MVRGSEGRGVCGSHSTHLLKNGTACPHLLRRQQGNNQSPTHCPFEGHLDIQVRRKDPSKQEGGDSEPAMQRKGLRNQFSFLVIFTMAINDHQPYFLPQGRTGDKQDTPEAQYTGFVKGLPALSLLLQPWLCEPSHNSFTEQEMESGIQDKMGQRPGQKPACTSLWDLAFHAFCCPQANLCLSSHLWLTAPHSGCSL